MEGARKRRIEETERRNLQQRTAKNQRIWAERKVVARQMAKEYLMLFKRDALKVLVDEGLLRRPSTFSLESHFIP
jgi:Radial spoke protein 3